jgi:hypothetical protein
VPIPSLSPLARDPYHTLYSNTIVILTKGTIFFVSVLSHRDCEVYAKAGVVNRRPVIREAQFLSQSSLCKICGEISATGTGCSQRTAVIPYD